MPSISAAVKVASPGGHACIGFRVYRCLLLQSRLLPPRRRLTSPPELVETAVAEVIARDLLPNLSILDARGQ